MVTTSSQVADSPVAGRIVAGQPVGERPARSASGLPMIAFFIVLLAAGIVLAIAASRAHGGSRAALAGVDVAAWLVFAVGLGGFTPVAPGHARVVQLFGKYWGTVRQPGLRYVNPFTRRITVSTRIRNQESAQIKVNDADGNPIEIAAVVVWRVQDTGKAVYAV